MRLAARSSEACDHSMINITINRPRQTASTFPHRRHRREPIPEPPPVHNKDHKLKHIPQDNGDNTGTTQEPNQPKQQGLLSSVRDSLVVLRKAMKSKTTARQRSRSTINKKPSRPSQARTVNRKRSGTYDGDKIKSNVYTFIFSDDEHDENECENQDSNISPHNSAKIHPGRPVSIKTTHKREVTPKTTRTAIPIQTKVPRCRRQNVHANMSQGSSTPPQVPPRPAAARVAKLLEPMASWQRKLLSNLQTETNTDVSMPLSALSLSVRDQLKRGDLSVRQLLRFTQEFLGVAVDPKLERPVVQTTPDVPLVRKVVQPIFVMDVPLYGFMAELHSKSGYQTSRCYYTQQDYFRLVDEAKKKMVNARFAWLNKSKFRRHMMSPIPRATTTIPNRNDSPYGCVKNANV